MRRLVAVLAAALLLPAAAADAAVTPKTIATGLSHPWGIAFLPDGDALVSERGTGRIYRVPREGGSKRVVKTIGDVDQNAGEGGLLGLAVSPRYRSDKRVFAYYTSTKGDNRIARFRLGGRVDPIVTGIRRGGIHNGGRLAFGPDGKLYASTGEVGEPSLAQDRSNLNGKVLRMNPDGSVPKGNPFKGSVIWSSGHRNVQGLAFDRRGRLWATEFGQNDVDEVNLIRRGRNYGWPAVEGRGDTDGGRYTNPKQTWSPTATCSPSGAAILGNRLYVAALAGESVYELRLNGRKAGAPKRLFRGRYGRVRTVVRAPGGGLWIATDNGDDRILRIPAP